MIAVIYFDVRHYSNLTVASFFLTALAGTLGCLIAFSLWPQIRFKSSERVLSVDPTGWKTTLGKLSGKRSWSEVRELAELPNAIYIVGVNKNAQMIPTRAFADQESRNQFLADIRGWYESAGKR